MNAGRLSHVRSMLRVPLAAVSFLTIVPVGRRITFTGADVARAGVLFPLVGAGIGALGGGVVWTTGLAAGPLAAAVLGIAVTSLVTGALHLDGLADTADSFGGRTRADALRIMRDHQVGAYGAVALVLNLLLKVAAVTPVAGSNSAVAAMVAAGAVSRASGLVLGATLPYAQPHPGAGAVLGYGNASARAIGGVVIAAVVCLVAVGARAGWPLGAAVVVTLVVGLLARRRLGGVTGDVLGAAAELVETAALVVVVAAL